MESTVLQRNSEKAKNYLISSLMRLCIPPPNIYTPDPFIFTPCSSNTFYKIIFYTIRNDLKKNFEIFGQDNLINDH